MHTHTYVIIMFNQLIRFDRDPRNVRKTEAIICLGHAERRTITLNAVRRERRRTANAVVPRRPCWTDASLDGGRRFWPPNNIHDQWGPPSVKVLSSRRIINVSSNTVPSDYYRKLSNRRAANAFSLTLPQPVWVTIK